MNILFFSPPGFDYTSSLTTEGLTLLSKGISSIKFYCTHASSHHGAVDSSANVIPEDEAYDLAKSRMVDMIIFSSAGNTFAWSSKERELLEDESLVDIKVFLDGCDSNELLVNPKLFRVYFKREMRFPQCNLFTLSNVRVLNYCIYDYLAKKLWLQPGYTDRDIDISFIAFGGSNKLREQAADVLKQLHGQHGLNVVCNVSNNSQPLPKDEYENILRRSKVGLSIIGAGLDTLRFWEIAGNGAIICSIDISNQLLMRYPYEANRHCIYFNNWIEMANAVLSVVKDSKRWSQMHNASCLHTLSYHTSVKRAQQIIDVFSEMCND